MAEYRFVPHLPDLIQPKHLQFVAIDWKKLKCHLRKHIGSGANELFTQAKSRATSTRRVMRYLRRKRISNPHRFLVPLSINKSISDAFNKWERHF